MPKKKIKNLTDEEMNNICSFYRNRGEGCFGDYPYKTCKCPLYFCGKCSKYLVQRERFLNSEVDVNKL